MSTFQKTRNITNKHPKGRKGNRYMATKVMTWDDAILKVLKENNRVNKINLHDADYK